MNIKNGDIVETIYGAHYRVTRVINSQFLEAVERPWQAMHTKEVQLQREEISAVIGATCKKCKGEAIYSEGVYRYVDGTVYCAPCGDREREKI